MIEDQRFKTLRHIETVRNYLNTCIRLLLVKAELHDQTKLQEPEREVFDKYTPLLRDLEYGSEEYKACLREMKPAIDHHNAHNQHHPEYWYNGIKDMDLLDLVEMLCDWKAAGLRHTTGDLIKSIEINKKRFGFSDDLEAVFKNTAKHLNQSHTYHHADES
jgi:hypothetical protein